jgi:hypothetical protein
VADPSRERRSVPRNLDRSLWDQFTATSNLGRQSNDAAGSAAHVPHFGLAICWKLGFGSVPRLQSFQSVRDRLDGKADYSAIEVATVRFLSAILRGGGLLRVLSAAWAAPKPEVERVVRLLVSPHRLLIAI